MLKEPHLARQRGTGMPIICAFRADKVRTRM
jgi:hypothetical protein